MWEILQDLDEFYFDGNLIKNICCQELSGISHNVGFIIQSRFIILVCMTALQIYLLIQFIQILSNENSIP